jgi:hypothetical protein
VFGVQSRARRTVAVGGATERTTGGDSDELFDCAGPGEPAAGLDVLGGTGVGVGLQPATSTIVSRIARILIWTPFLDR